MSRKNKIYKILIILCMVIGITGSVAAVDTVEKNIKNSNDINTVVNDNTITEKSNITGDVKENQNTEEQGETVSKKEEGLTNHDIGLLAAALATGLACIGAGIAVAMVASSAIGAISENPSLLGKTIIFAGLAEGIAIYGLIISIMILNKI